MWIVSSKFHVCRYGQIGNATVSEMKHFQKDKFKAFFKIYLMKNLKKKLCELNLMRTFNTSTKLSDRYIAVLTFVPLWCLSDAA